MFTTCGSLSYSKNPYKLIVVVDDEIGKYYRSLIPKIKKIQKPLYPSHISVLRNEIPINSNLWEKYNDYNVFFKYDNFISNDETYYWLGVESPILESIRIELGLNSSSEFTRSPDDNHKFHITLANTKHHLLK